MDDCTFTDLTATNGAGLSSYASQLTLLRTNFTNCVAGPTLIPDPTFDLTERTLPASVGGAGGALLAEAGGPLVLSGCGFDGCRAWVGGALALFNTSVASLVNASLTNNLADFGGGALFALSDWYGGALVPRVQGPRWRGGLVTGGGLRG